MAIRFFYRFVITIKKKILNQKTKFKKGAEI